MTDKWVILRTSSRNTMRLVSDLLRDGFEIWTPQRTFCKRAPRNLGVYQVNAPMLPSFAFAKASHVHSLMALSNDLVKPCPDFSVFHYMNEIPLIGDHELESLRMLEERERRRAETDQLASRKRQVIFRPGEKIRIEFGAFAGMSGVIEKDDGRFALVSFDGLKPVKFSTFILSGKNILCSSTPTDKAA